MSHLPSSITTLPDLAEESEPLRLPFWTRLLLLTTLAVVFRLTVMQRRREADAFAQIDTAAALEIGLVGVTAFLLAIRSDVVLRLFGTLRNTSGGWLLLFFTLAMTSAAWSAMPTYSLFRAGQFTVESIALLVILARAVSFVHAERLLLLVAFAVLLMDAYPNLVAAEFQVSGMRSNSFAVSALMLFCYGFGEALVRPGKSRQWLLGVAALALVLMVVGRSLASWWCALFAVGFAFLIARIRLDSVILIALIAGLWVADVGVEKVRPLIDPHGEIEKVETMHGRTILWEAYWETIRERPWLGMGYAVGPRIAGPVYTTNAHNSAIAVLLGTGAIGGSLVVVAACVGLRYGLRVCAEKRPGAVGSVVALAAGAGNSMSISIFGDTWMPSSFVFMLFYGFFLVAVLRPPWSVEWETPP